MPPIDGPAGISSGPGDETARWLAVLSGGGLPGEQALARLHDLLLRNAH